MATPTYRRWEERAADSAAIGMTGRAAAQRPANMEGNVVAS